MRSPGVPFPEITTLTATEAQAALPQLITLLQDAVADGASLGFLAPLSEDDARSYCEVQKLCVHTAARKRGVGRALMLAVEDAARQAHRTLLVLDTRHGDPAEHLYASLGYTVAGTIPRFTLDSDGQFHDTVLLYRELA